MSGEVLEFSFDTFHVKLSRDPELAENVIFEISRKGWTGPQILDFLKQLFGSFREDEKYVYFKEISDDWVKLHKFLLLVTSYFRGDIKIEELKLVEYRNLEILLIKPRLLETANRIRGIIRFKLDYSETLGRAISLEEAKEAFLGLFKYLVLKDGIKALMSLMIQK